MHRLRQVRRRRHLRLLKKRGCCLKKRLLLKARLAKGRAKLRSIRLLQAKVIAGEVIPNLKNTTTDVFSTAEKIKRRIRVLKLRHTNRRIKLALTSLKKKGKRSKLKKRLERASWLSVKNCSSSWKIKSFSYRSWNEIALLQYKKVEKAKERPRDRPGERLWERSGERSGHSEKRLKVSIHDFFMREERTESWDSASKENREFAFSDKGRKNADYVTSAKDRKLEDADVDDACVVLNVEWP